MKLLPDQTEIINQVCQVIFKGRTEGSTCQITTYKIHEINFNNINF